MTETLHQVQVEDERDLGTTRGVLQYPGLQCPGPIEISHEMGFLSSRDIYSILGKAKHLQRAMRRASGKQEKNSVGILG